MSETTPAPQEASSKSTPSKSTWLQAAAVYARPRVLVVMLLGFSAGLPLALSGSTLTIWMREAGVDLGTIGLFALVGTPYTLKFLWAPVVDALSVPILTRLFGRRRGWLMLSQLLLAAAILLLAFSNPAYSALTLVALAALLVAVASATQDILIDAFRVESLDATEQAAGMASYVAAYRVSNLISTAGALYLVTGWEWLGASKDTAWSLAYMVMAALVGIGIAATFLATEPSTSKGSNQDWESQRPQIASLSILGLKLPAFVTDAINAMLATRVGTAAYNAFSEFLKRDAAVTVLAFVILYKLCDAFAGVMTAPFVIDLGFSRDDYASIVKILGLIATLLGGFLGGFLARVYPLVTCLWAGAFLQMASNLVFTWQAYVGLNHLALSVSVFAEQFTGAIGTVIFVAYLSALCRSPLHTATQFALLTALAAVGRTYISASSGYLAMTTGWAWFFSLSALTAIPSLVLLWWLQHRGHFETLAAERK
jgi:PAT family beta-lactamase induction signal transducer AmpG